MGVSEWRKMKFTDLLTEERSLREKSFNLRCKHSVGQLKETNSLRQIKKDIARICTILSDKKRTEKDEKGA